VQVCVFYAVLNNYFEGIAVEDVRKKQDEFVDYLGTLHEEDILKPIRETGLFDEAVENKLKEALTRFLAK
jgi:F0F1-type ATP synthase alpha subunit